MNLENTYSFYWKSAPTRDDFLERIYFFVKLIKKQETKSEFDKLIKVSDIDKLFFSLEYHISRFVTFQLDDEELEDYKKTGFFNILDDLSFENEDLSEPEFSGNEINMTINEFFRIHLIVQKQKTPVRLVVRLSFSEAGYYPELIKIEQT